jgi:outer membrane protein TolC
VLSFGSWKGQAMKTLEELQAELTQELLELQRLTGIWPSTVEKRHVKEQAIGRLCAPTRGRPESA